MVSQALDDLLQLLDLEAIEVNIFRGGHTDENRIRTFGGQVAAQALVAAGRTVESDKFVHSLHAYFLRPGDPHKPILYEVDRIREGKSFVTRRVVAIQHGEAIFHLSASFHREEVGIEHQDVMPQSVDPMLLQTHHERYAHLIESGTDEQKYWYTRPRPIDLRYVDSPVERGNGVEREAKQQCWFKPDGELPDDKLLHACVITYASDMSLLDSILIAHDYSWDDGKTIGASLDHAVWFHRPVDANQWMLYDQHSSVARGARALANGEIWSQSGELLVSVVQEGLIRRKA